jgi:hypothetical protein
MADAVELEVMETTAVGQAAFRDGDIETAKFSFGRVLELDPSNQAVRQMLRLVEMTVQSAAATRAARPGAPAVDPEPKTGKEEQAKLGLSGPEALRLQVRQLHRLDAVWEFLTASWHQILPNLGENDCIACFPSFVFALPCPSQISPSTEQRHDWNGVQIPLWFLWFLNVQVYSIHQRIS